jgi:hypothetical protein
MKVTDASKSVQTIICWIDLFWNYGIFHEIFIKRAVGYMKILDVPAASLVKKVEIGCISLLTQRAEGGSVIRQGERLLMV